jgi:uncharacterized membrane protein YdjX (TVP38/TMEM64 family)
MQENGKPAVPAIDWKKEESPFTALKRLGIFLLIAVAGALISHFTPHGAWLSVDRISELAQRLGKAGPLFILAAGILTPLLFIPRWPLAFLGGLLYGVTWGALLATFASTLGAWLHFSLSLSLLAPLSDRLRRKFRIERFVVPKHKEFAAIFIMRAFPLSNFVATNLIAGALRMDRGKFVLASFLGMIPSSLMYAAWGKLMKKPSPHFYIVAVAGLLLIVVGTVVAEKVIHKWQSARNDS